MKNVIDKLENMIALETASENKSKEELYYISGLCDALELLKKSVADSLVAGGTYYVIMYRDGNMYLPYIQKMKLYKISQKSKKCSYCFTTNLTKDSKLDKPDLVLASKVGITNRVFYTRKDAEKAISL